MEPADTLTTFFKHNLWANIRLIEQCAELTNEQLDTAIPAARGSIHDTLEHIVRAEKSYFSRISTGQPYLWPEEMPPMTIADMMESARATGSGFIEWASRVQAGDTVQINWDGEMRDVPKTIILTQVIAHAAEHREQVKAILTQLGIEPLDLQSWAYFDDIEN